MTNTDDDVAGITVTPTSGLTTTEAGGTATFTVVLNSQPTANVTIGLSSSDLTEGTVAPAQRHVHARQLEHGPDGHGDRRGRRRRRRQHRLHHRDRGSVSTDPIYSGFDPSDVSVTNTDDDAAGITVTPTSGLTTTEAGGTATFTVVLELASRPRT